MKTYQVIIKLIKNYGLLKSVSFSELYSFVEQIQSEFWNENAKSSFSRYKLLLDKSNEATKRLRANLLNELTDPPQKWPKDIAVNVEEIKNTLDELRKEQSLPVTNLSNYMDPTGTSLPPNRRDYLLSKEDIKNDGYSPTGFSNSL
jgi:hypothetical protein